MAIFGEIAKLMQLLRKVHTGQEFGFSFNVADRCPINCNCYWRAQTRVTEMTDDEVVCFFHGMRDQGFLLVTLVGGEPYVRPELLEKLTPIMPANWLVTSGTSPLQHFPRTTHFVSVDGATAETHDTVRKSPGLFNRILRNTERARVQGNILLFIHAVLNARNQNEIRDILRFWHNNQLADGVVFSTHTPIRNSQDDELRLSRGERVQIIQDLLHCREEFGDFVVNTPAMIRSLHPDVTARQTPATCGTARFVPSFDAAGERMQQCILSEKADCTECGCVVTTMIDTITSIPPHLDGVRMLAKLRAV